MITTSRNRGRTEVSYKNLGSTPVSKLKTNFDIRNSRLKPLPRYFWQDRGSGCLKLLPCLSCIEDYKSEDAANARSGNGDQDSS